jgi:hypothetical protein
MALRFAVLLCPCLAGVWSVTAAAQAPEQASAELQAVLEQADERFVQQDFRTALALLEPACAASLEPACAFGLGAVHHALGHCEEAVGHYRRYRELTPAGEHTEEVLLALAQLEARCGGTGAGGTIAVSPSVALAIPSAPAPSPLLAEPRIIASPFAQPALQARHDSTLPALAEQAPGARHDLIVVSLLGLGGASALTALTMGMLSLNSADACRNRSVYDESYQQECQVREPRYRSLALGFGVAAGALLAGGITLWWLDEQSQASVGLALNGPPELRYQRRF